MVLKVRCAKKSSSRTSRKWRISNATMLTVSGVITAIALVLTVIVFTTSDFGVFANVGDFALKMLGLFPFLLVFPYVMFLTHCCKEDARDDECYFMSALITFVAVAIPLLMAVGVTAGIMLDGQSRAFEDSVAEEYKAEHHLTQVKAERIKEGDEKHWDGVIYRFTDPKTSKSEYVQYEGHEGR